jgi:tetratricopeptide (TPR) repeat protein
MSKEEAYFEQIEAYLSGQLTEEARKALEAEMATDAELTDLVAQHRAEHRLLQMLKRQNTIERLKKWDKEIESHGTASPTGASQLKKFGLVYLFTLAVLGYGIYWFNQRKPQQPAAPVPGHEENNVENPTDTSVVSPSIAPLPTPKPRKATPEYIALAEKYYEPPGNLRNGGGRTPVALDSAKTAFLLGNYSEAVQLFERIVAKDSSILNQNLLAHAYFKNKQYSLAAVRFEAVERRGIAPFQQSSQWSQALCYVALFPKFNKEATRLLKTIRADTAHNYQAKADTLLNTLRRLEKSGQ